MVSLGLDATALRLELTRGEKLAALRKANVTIPWVQILSVEPVADPIRLLHGLRAPGLARSHQDRNLAIEGSQDVRRYPQGRAWPANLAAGQYV